MHIDSSQEFWDKDDNPCLRGLVVECPVCRREFVCNKSYHVYTALVGRKRQYYCSYSCYKKRADLKGKRGEDECL